MCLGIEAPTDLVQKHAGGRCQLSVRRWSLETAVCGLRSAGSTALWIYPAYGWTEGWWRECWTYAPDWCRPATGLKRGAALSSPPEPMFGPPKTCQGHRLTGQGLLAANLHEVVVCQKLSCQNVGWPKRISAQVMKSDAARMKRDTSTIMRWEDRQPFERWLLRQCLIDEEVLAYSSLAPASLHLDRASPLPLLPKLQHHRRHQENSHTAHD